MHSNCISLPVPALFFEKRDAMNTCRSTEMIVDIVDQFLRRAKTLVTSTGQRLVDDRLIVLQRIAHAGRIRVFVGHSDFFERAAREWCLSGWQL